VTNSSILSGFKEHRLVLSILWVFVLMNMIYADILNTLKPAYLAELEFVSTELSGEMVLLFAVLMEIPIIMIPLARLLNRKINRIAHFIAVPITILWVILPSVFSSGTPPSYIFFATIEVISMLFLFWYAWNWEEETEG
jgi:hypothetical protein